MSDWEASEGEHWATNADRYTRMPVGEEPRRARGVRVRRPRPDLGSPHRRLVHQAVLVAGHCDVVDGDNAAEAAHFLRTTGLGSRRVR